MNGNKAKEYFSQYHENSLDAGLRQSFERELRENAQLAAEYRAFAAIVDGLDSLRHNVIEVPSDLHDRISARLDRAEWESKQRHPVSWLNWWKSLALGGVACVAIIGAIASLKGNGDTRSSANFTSVEALSGGRPTFGAEGTRLTLETSGNSTEFVDVRMGSEKLSTITIGPRERIARVNNPNPRAQIITLSLRTSKDLVVFALPGTQRAAALQGNGNVHELACALADFYRIPIEVSSTDPTIHVSWTLDRVDSSKTMVQGTQISIEHTAKGILKLSQP